MIIKILSELIRTRMELMFSDRCLVISTNELYMITVVSRCGEDQLKLICTISHRGQESIEIYGTVVRVGSYGSTRERIAEQSYLDSLYQLNQQRLDLLLADLSERYYNAIDQANARR